MILFIIVVGSTSFTYNTQDVARSFDKNISFLQSMECLLVTWCATGHLSHNMVQAVFLNIATKDGKGPSRKYGLFVPQ